MMTEEMLASLIDSLKGVERLILVGDPRQLPPIGAGRPFVDIVAHLAPENVESIAAAARGRRYVELTVKRRHVGEGVLDVDRDDVQLADWFSGAPVAPGEDDIFTRALENGGSQSLRFVHWSEAADLRQLLLDVIAEELNLAGRDDVDGFARSLGGSEYEGASTSIADVVVPMPRSVADPVASPWADAWRARHQPSRSGDVPPRHDRVGAGSAEQEDPKPMGPEDIVYGDKVINVRNMDARPARVSERQVRSSTSPTVRSGSLSERGLAKDGRSVHPPRG